MRTEHIRKFHGGLLGRFGEGVSATEWANIGTQVYQVGKDIFSKTPSGQVTYIPTASTQPQFSTPPPAAQPATDYTQYLPIALIGLLGIGAIMAFKKK